MGTVFYDGNKVFTGLLPDGRYSAINIGGWPPVTESAVSIDRSANPATTDCRPIDLRSLLTRMVLDNRSDLSVKRILKSGPATIVFWGDNTKTIVKRAEDEEESDYAAFTAALAKKVYGSNSAVIKMIKKKTEYQAE